MYWYPLPSRPKNLEQKCTVMNVLPFAEDSEQCKIHKKLRSVLDHCHDDEGPITEDTRSYGVGWLPIGIDVSERDEYRYSDLVVSVLHRNVQSFTLLHIFTPKYIFCIIITC